MSKLYRSLLWSGLVVAGVAACGDDVTVQPPPPPPAATVHSVSVAPTGVTVGTGTTLQMVATVNADAGEQFEVADKDESSLVVHCSVPASAVFQIRCWPPSTAINWPVTARASMR